MSQPITDLPGAAVEPPAVRLRDGLLARLLAHARAAAPHECMGLLASRPGAGPGNITAACLLPAVASASQAIASPLTIQQAATRLASKGLRPRGIWHSHGRHKVFHSATDDDTVLRLLPAMAEANYLSPCPRALAPVVTGPDSALLPLLDGRASIFELLGPKLPGMDARERVAWARIKHDFVAANRPPCAIQRSGALRLRGGGVSLSLGVPEGASVVSRCEDLSPVRSATLYSLVVNERGDSYAEAVEVWDVGARLFIEKAPCTIEIVSGPEATASPDPVSA